MSLWSELRRRNVFKVGAAYAVAAWLIVQVVSAIDAPLGLPEWFDTAVIVLLAVGFLVALLLAWAYEVTPEGIKATKHVSPAESVTRLTGNRFNYIVTALLVLAVGFMAADNYLIGDSARDADAAATAEAPGPAPAPSNAGSVAAARRKVAVLPCDNLSPNPNDAYFAAGIHEEILNQLAKIGSLLVVARTSVLQYADNKPAIPEIARALGATAIMECSVRYAGDDILVTAQLIDPDTDSHVWSETYPGNLSNLGTIFAMQADIAMNIANALQAEFSPAEQARLEAIPTESPEAYALLLAALAEDDPERAVGLLEQAVALDAEFADAYAAIAFSLALTTVNTINNSATRTWSEVGARAIENAERAVAIDPDAVFAHGAHAVIDEISWRWADARASYARAYELNPNEPAILWRYAWFSTFAGAHEEGRRLAEHLIELQPTESGAFTNLSLVLALSGDVAGAMTACRRAIALNPNAILCQHALGMLNARLGNAAAAEAQFRLIEGFLGTNRFIAFLPQLAVGYSQIGRNADAARIVAEVESIGNRADIGTGALATTYLAIGDEERVLELLRSAVEKVERREPDPGYYDLMNIKNNAWGLPMLEQPEFRAVRARLGTL